MKSAVAASCLLAAVLAPLAQAQSPALPLPASKGSGVEDMIPAATPYPADTSDSTPHLEPRQNLGQNPDAGAIPTQVSPVIIYSIVSQVGPSSGVDEVYTYTQRFSTPLDQFPDYVAGTIGYGTLKTKRDVDAQPTPSYNTEYIAQPLIVAMETVIITRPLRRVTRLLVVETVIITANSSTSNSTAPFYGNGTFPLNGTYPYPMGNGTYPYPIATGTAPGINVTFPTNVTTPDQNTTVPTSTLSADGAFNVTMTITYDFGRK